ncbi:DUF302 domain-containing protein [Streptomyces halobius]|uniref:DUF302 domain-containing protein n=1 Tax=Streptomyces halobius TaxID=2879846 RepID=A0ABY4M1P6_9ACTN|nr:DUF302 domain-containing protein [Streptomyces halobius]UQA91108.1 DUF302 domain-containing protein [Streptomyces halobius]
MSLTRKTFRTAPMRYSALTAGAVVLALGATACGTGDSDTSTSEKSPSPASTAGKTSEPGEAAQAKFTSYASSTSFDDTVSALKKSVADNGMMVLGDLNQAGALKSTGLSLKGAHTFFVGNPAKGKMFFQKNPAIGAEIPVRMYVWADDEGTTHIGYFDPAPMFKAIDPELADGGKQMAMAVEKITKGAAGGTSTKGTTVAAAFTTVDSAKSFDATVSALKKSVADNGMMVLGDLNQAGALKSTGLSLKGAHAYFVGNPAKGKMFFQKNPAIGAVIPLTMYTWADNDGTAHIGYFDPAALFKAVDENMADGGKQMKMAADKIANGAAK